MTGTPIRLRADHGLQETVAATHLSAAQYRLEATPLVAAAPIYRGDVVELEALPDGTFRLGRILHRAPFRHHSSVVNRWFAGSAEYRVFWSAVEGVGGTCEGLLNGLLYVHLPDGSDFDVEAALDHQLRLNARRLGVIVRSFWARLWNK